MLTLHHVASMLGFGLGLALVLRLLRQRNRPSVTFAWLLAMVAVPYLGVPLYLLLAGRKVRNRSATKDPLRTGTESRAPGIPAGLGAEIERLLRSEGFPSASEGNSLSFLPDGSSAFAALERLIGNARRTIHVSTFILGRDPVGRRLVSLLAARAAEGVEVRVLVDALGSMGTRGAFLDPLRAKGGRVGVFMPILPLRRRWSANLRNHRKLAVADAETAWLGGMNLAEEYLGPAPAPGRWVDASMLAVGPVAADLEALFRADWAFATGENLPAAAPSAPRGRESAWAQVVPSGPDVAGDGYAEAVLVGVLGARRRVWIVTPYFVPDEPLFKALDAQARMGRDVRIVVPARSNHRLADLARGRFLRSLAAAGARIFAVPDRMVHAKLLVFDDDLATVGSANLDMRSLYLNYELSLFVTGRDETARIAAWIEELCAQATPVDTAAPGPVREWGEDLSLLVSSLM